MDSGSLLPVAAAVNTDSYGKGGDLALQSVFKIISPDTYSSGTGFLHKSGHIITAQHVVSGQLKPRVELPDGSSYRAKIIAIDYDLDLALLLPSTAFRSTVNAKPLVISNSTGLNIGTQVSTWGFPGGYTGSHPMLSVGVLSAIASYERTPGKPVKQWVVNAAFNSGNSGGPLLHIETGEVIGVVSSKLAPISPMAQSMIAALEQNNSGFSYTGTGPNGASIRMSEGQIVAHVLQELRAQVQLVIGMAVLLDNLRNFLSSLGIDP